MARKRATGAQLDAAFRSPPKAGTGEGVPIVNGNRSGQGLPGAPEGNSSGFSLGVNSARGNKVASGVDSRCSCAGKGTRTSARILPANAGQELVTNGSNNPRPTGGAAKEFA